MLKKVLKLAGIGFLLGVTVCTFITSITADPLPVSSALVETTGSPAAAMLIQMLFAGLYGALCMGTTVLYDIDRLPLALTSFLHCLICIVPFVPLSAFLGWSGGAADTLIMLFLQLAAYFIVWLIMYAGYRKEIGELNKMKKQRQKLSESEEKER